MTKRIIFTYLGVGFIPIFLAYLLCFHFWWVDIDMHFPTLIAVGITWIASNYLGVLISRLTYFKDLGEDYIGLIKLIGTEFLKDSIGKSKSGKLRNLVSLFAALIFLLIATIFYFQTKNFEIFQ